MKYFNELESYQEQGRTAITLGKFDGIHRGHQKLIQSVVKHAKEDAIKSVVFAFDMQPLYERLDVTKRNLMTSEERQAFLEGKVDCLVECPFTKEICHTEAEEFIRDVLVDRFHVKYVVVGTDFRFGYEKRGDYHMLKKYAEIYDYTVEVVEKERYKDRVISSTYIRETVKAGDIALANELLGYPYTLEGTVMRGNGLGTPVLGIPTMNLIPESDKLVPPSGVYVNTIEIGGKKYEAIANIGVKPTVEETKKLVLETHAFGYEGNAYGEWIKVQLYEFRRAEKKFETLEELKKQMEKDIAYGKQYFKREM